MMKIQEQEATLTSSDGTPIFARAWLGNEQMRVVLCVQGLGGHGGYYNALAHYLTPEGTVVVAPDLRGHGRSHGVRGDIDRFERYLEDIEATVAWARECWPALPIILLGESMGASICIQYLARTPHPEHIAGLVLVSPVLRASIQPTLREALLFMRSLPAPARPSMPVTGREELGCRDHEFNARLKADPLFVRHVSIRFLNSLNTWLRQSRRNAHHVRHPLLVLQGECDYVAHPRGTAAFLRRARVPVQQRRVVTFPGAYHCLLYDPATPDVMQILSAWLVPYSSQEKKIDTPY